MSARYPDHLEPPPRHVREEAATQELEIGESQLARPGLLGEDGLDFDHAEARKEVTRARVRQELVRPPAAQLLMVVPRQVARIEEVVGHSAVFPFGAEVVGE
jgi:hypothetical protein